MSRRCRYTFRSTDGRTFKVVITPVSYKGNPSGFRFTLAGRTFFRLRLTAEEVLSDAKNVLNKMLLPEGAEVIVEDTNG